MRAHERDALLIATAFVAALLLMLPALASAAPDSIVTVEDNESTPGYPAVALDEHGSPHLVWQDSATGRMTSAWLDPASGHIAGPRVLNGDSPGIATIPTPRIVSSGSRLFVAWIDCCTVAAIAQSSDGGATFTTPLSAPAETPADVDIAADSAGTLYVVWRGVLYPGAGAVAFSTLPSGSSTFSPRQILQPSDARSPAIAVAGSKVYVAWGGANGSVMLNLSVDGGRSFLPAIPVDTTASWFPMTPRLVATATRLFAVWASSGGNATVPRFATSTDGRNFSAPVDLDWGFGGADPQPTLALGGGGSVYAAWSSVGLSAESSTGILRVRKADANGSNWQDVTTYSEPGTGLIHAGLAVDAHGHYFLVHDRMLHEMQTVYQVRLVTDLAFPWEPDTRFVAIVAILGVAVAVLGVAASVLLRPRRKSGTGEPEPVPGRR